MDDGETLNTKSTRVYISNTGSGSVHNTVIKSKHIMFGGVPDHHKTLGQNPALAQTAFLEDAHRKWTMETT